jgi:hypothetical protein
MAQSRGSIAFFTTYRPPVPLDIFFFFFERKGTSVPNFIDREEAKSTTGTPGG